MKALLILGFFAFFLTPIYAQKDKSKKVKTSYLHIPIMNAIENNPENLIIEFGSQPVTFGKEALKDVKTVCKNNATGKAQEVTTYYYDVSYTSPESFVVGSDASGNTIFAIKISEEMNASEKYGFQECKNFRTDNLKKTWAADASKFKNKIINDVQNKLYEEALTTAKQSIYAYYLPMEFEIYYAKDKVFDYTDLENAVEWASNACSRVDKEGLNNEVIEEFRKSIAVWEKELVTAQVEDDKARINKSIAKGLHENCAWSYTMIHEFDKALEHGRQFAILFGNYSNNRTTDMNKLLAMVRDQKIRAENNQTLVENITAMNQMAQDFKKNKLKINQLPNTETERLSNAYFQFAMQNKSDRIDDMKKQEAQLVEDGKVNPYAKYVNRTITGNSILINFPPSTFSGIPELTVFPKEICEIEDIDQVMITSNKIASIPPEIANMKVLTNLNLSSNAFTNIPAVIGQLSKLEKLDLSNNPITDFSQELGQLVELKKLNLKKTKLSPEKQDALKTLLPNCKISF